VMCECRLQANTPAGLLRYLRIAGSALGRSPTVESISLALALSLGRSCSRTVLPCWTIPVRVNRR